MANSYQSGDAFARDAINFGAAEWLCLAAAPTFAIMALLTSFGAQRNDSDVRADERFSRRTLGEVDFPPTKRRPPALIRQRQRVELALRGARNSTQNISN